MRIASLLASGTELVCRLGAGDQLVGRSHECDNPAWVTRLPVLSRPTFDVSGTSGEIDRFVREKLAARAPLYEVDEAALAALQPDVVISQTHCEVCAVSAGVCRRTPVAALSTGSLDGILDGIGAVAGAIGRAREGQALVLELQVRRQDWVRRTAPLAPVSVVCLEWTDPPFAMGNWGPELVALAGGRDLIGTAGAHSRPTRWDDVRAADPEVLIVAPCGFGLERAWGEMPMLAQRPGFRALRAAREGRVYVADGNLYFNRSGPGVFDTIDLLAEMLHPEVYPPQHEGRRWRPWPAGPEPAHAPRRRRARAARRSRQA